MKLTKWYSASIKPVREGVYETRCKQLQGWEVKEGSFQHWNGKWWGENCASIDLAQKYEPYETGWTITKWRGVKK